MRFSLPTISLVAGLINASVMVRDADNDSVSRRDFVHLYVCTDVSFGGICQNLGTNTGVCNPLGPPFYNSVSSAGPDNGVTCTLFSAGACTGNSQPLTYPGSSDLRQLGFNDVAESYICED